MSVKICFDNGKIITVDDEDDTVKVLTSPCVRFTVSSDIHHEDTLFEDVCDAINTYCGGAGLFHVTTGDLTSQSPTGSSDDAANIRTVIDSKFGVKKKWIPVVGNHDVSDNSGASLTWIENEWTNANGSSDRDSISSFGTNEATNSDGTQYSFTINNVTFIVLNVYWDGTAPNVTDGKITYAHLDWLETVLNADENPKFIFYHEPAYPFDNHESDSLNKYSTTRDLFWQILEEANCVIIAFSGHTHMHSIYQPNPSLGVYQFDMGDAGHDYTGNGFTFANVSIDDDDICVVDIWRDEDKDNNWVKDSTTEINLRECEIVVAPSSSSTSSTSSSSGGDHDHDHDHHHHHHHHHAGAMSFDVLSDEEVEFLINKYSPQMRGMSNSEKEDFLIDRVVTGNMSGDEALVLALHENLDLDT
jgi:hypothetical protein